MRSIMVRVDEGQDVSALHIVSVNQVHRDKPCVVVTTTGTLVADCSKGDMKKRIDLAWEGR